MTITIVTENPPSAPKAPPFQNEWSAGEDEEKREQDIFSPLTSIPKTLPWTKFQTECIAPTPQIFPVLIKYKEKTAPTSRRFTTASGDMPGFPR